MPPLPLRHARWVCSPAYGSSFNRETPAALTVGVSEAGGVLRTLHFITNETGQREETTRCHQHGGIGGVCGWGSQSTSWATHLLTGLYLLLTQYAVGLTTSGTSAGLAGNSGAAAASFRAKTAKNWCGSRSCSSQLTVGASRTGEQSVIATSLLSYK
jgi:hypothetical protein